MWFCLRNGAMRLVSQDLRTRPEWILAGPNLPLADTAREFCEGGTLTFGGIGTLRLILRTSALSRSDRSLWIWRISFWSTTTFFMD